MFIARRQAYILSSVRSGICPWQDVAPNGAREQNVAHRYKHYAPPERGIA
jgi:hypothetical protein